MGTGFKRHEVGGQAVLGRQLQTATPWLTERHGYDPTLRICVRSLRHLRAALPHRHDAACPGVFGPRNASLAKAWARASNVTSDARPPRRPGLRLRVFFWRSRAWETLVRRRHEPAGSCVAASPEPFRRNCPVRTARTCTLALAPGDLAVTSAASPPPLWAAAVPRGKPAIEPRSLSGGARGPTSETAAGPTLRNVKTPLKQSIGESASASSICGADSFGR